MSTPNPGSDEAVAQGCTCPVMDNGRGRGMPDGKGGTNYWISGDCQLHARGVMPGAIEAEDRALLDGTVDS